MMTKLEELKLAVDKTVEARHKSADDGCTEAWQVAWEAWEVANDLYMGEYFRLNKED
jgi:hypothetical protein